MTGGDLIAEVLLRRGVKFVFTLCGGHISPILVSAQERGIRVIDVRDEASAAFAADAVSRLTGNPGVAVVTAGPGLTNILTAVKNAGLAQSPLVVVGGATATVLKDCGALQDIDQLTLFEPHVKWMATVDRVRDLVPAMEEAFDEARLGVAGPVFVECPVDLLYEESVVRRFHGVGEDEPAPEGLSEAFVRWHLKRHLRRVFARSDRVKFTEPPLVPPVEADATTVRRVAAELVGAERPVALVGSQALLGAAVVEDLAAALDEIGIPVYLSGMARGLLGCTHPRLFRHRRRQALKEADLVILAGVPCDFRLDYGRQISRRARLIAVNLSDHDLAMNRRPDRAIVAHPGFFLRALAGAMAAGDRWQAWTEVLGRRDADREDDIAERAKQETEYVNPIHLCREIDDLLGDDSVIVADGGDFAATAAYTVRPRRPLSWLDPGMFGTLGVGGGFAIAAKLVRPQADVWLLYGDGSAAYSLAELDTCARHGLPVIAVVGNDGGWTQVAREQVAILGDDCGTVLRRSDYHRVAEGYGGRGLLLERPEEVSRVLAEAREIARGGTPVLVNALIGRTDFRKESISM